MEKTNKNYTTFVVSAKIHVVCNVSERKTHPSPNYMNTKKALCGIIEKDSTLEAWKEKFKKKDIV